MTRIRCTFTPQAWVNDYAVEVDPQGETVWEMSVEDVPKSGTYDSDNLRDADEAPEWVKSWSGPFEVYVEPVEEDPREKGDDDGVEYADPRDYMDGTDR